MFVSELGGVASLVGQVARNINDFIPLLGVGKGKVGVAVAEDMGAFGEEVGSGFTTMEDRDVVLAVEKFLDDGTSDELGSPEY